MAQKTIKRLQPIVMERREKMKDEMIGEQLNWCLQDNPFEWGSRHNQGLYISDSSCLVNTISAAIEDFASASSFGALFAVGPFFLYACSTENSPCNVALSW